MAKYSNKDVYILFVVLAIIFALWMLYTRFRKYSLKEGQRSMSGYKVASDRNIYYLDDDGETIIDEDGNDTGYSIDENANVINEDGEIVDEGIEFLENSEDTKQGPTTYPTDDIYSFTYSSDSPKETRAVMPKKNLSTKGKQ